MAGSGHAMEMIRKIEFNKSLRTKKNPFKSVREINLGDIEVNVVPLSKKENLVIRTRNKKSIQKDRKVRLVIAVILTSIVCFAVYTAFMISTLF